MRKILLIVIKACFTLEAMKYAWRNEKRPVPPKDGYIYWRLDYKEPPDIVIMYRLK